MSLQQSSEIFWAIGLSNILSLIVDLIVIQYRTQEVNRALAEQIVVNICLWDIVLEILNTILNTYLIIIGISKLTVFTVILWCLQYLALCNSLLWAFTIPKFIHDELIYGQALTKELYIITRRNIFIVSLLIIISTEIIISIFYNQNPNISNYIFLPIVTIFGLLMFYYCIRIYLFLKQKNLQKNFNYILFLFPTIVLITQLPIMINSIIIGYDNQYHYVNIVDEVNILIFFILQATIGIWNAMAYGMLLRKKYQWQNYSLWSIDTTLIEIILGQQNHIGSDIL